MTLILSLINEGARSPQPLIGRFPSGPDSNTGAVFLSDLKGAVLIALAFVASGLIGKPEPASAVAGVQTFERQGRP
jgi:hypothetical protein